MKWNDEIILIRFIPDILFIVLTIHVLDAALCNQFGILTI